jgi:signal transduction histidine kinase
MDLAIDHIASKFKLSATSQKMLELRHEVFAQWEHSVRASCDKANVLKPETLINTLPSFYDCIAESITSKHPRINAATAMAMAFEHGGERARLTSYGPKEVILDFQLLKSALLDILKRHGVALAEDELQTIDASIEGAIGECVTGYVLAVQALREQSMAALLHDLLNPLAVASANASLIMQTTQSPQTKASAVTIFKNAERMDEMIHTLLDVMAFHGGGQLALNLFNFDILELVKHVGVQAEATHGPRFIIAGLSAEVFWSHDEVHRALENLIGNAVKYGAPNTPISIKLDRISDRLSVSVHNMGKPIPPDEFEDIFQVFKRARSARQSSKEGWGIGLPFVRAVAQSHGGSCRVDSSRESGTTFAIEMPVDARTFRGGGIQGATKVEQ